MTKKNKIGCGLASFLFAAILGFGYWATGVNGIILIFIITAFMATIITAFK